MNRFQAKGLLQIAVLKLISKEPSHGYRIMCDLRKMLSIPYGSSTIYPLLNNLEEKGFVKSTWYHPEEIRELPLIVLGEAYVSLLSKKQKTKIQRSRKIYHITQRGVEQLRKDKETLEIILKPILAEEICT